MIVKWSSLPTGFVFTGTFYDASVSPEVSIPAAGGVFTEDAGATGVYRRDVGVTLAGFTLVRVRLTPGNRDSWILVSLGDQETAGDPALLNISEIETGVNTLLSRVTSTLFSGITSVRNWLSMIMGNAADAPTLAEVNATTAGATYDNTSMSLQALNSDLDSVILDLDEILTEIGEIDCSGGTLFYIVTTPASVCGSNLYAFVAEDRTFTLEINDPEGNPVDLSPELEVVIENERKSNIQTIEDADLGKVGNQLTFTVDGSLYTYTFQGYWSVRIVSTGEVIAHGRYNVSYASTP